MPPQRSSNVTINDVAREAGVSKTTASFVLSDRPGIHLAPGTRQRVRDVAHRLGYRRSGLAAALSVGRIYTVGLLLQVNGDNGDSAASISPYCKDIIVSLTCACARADLRLTTILARGDDATIRADEIADGRVDGLVVSSLRNEALARALYATSFPVVSVGSGYAERHIPIDNNGGGRLATEHLWERGHRAIVYVTYPDRRAQSRSAIERQKGYEAALQDRGQTPQVLSIDDAIAALDRPAADRFSACFCMNDHLACVLLQAARARGLDVPRNLSLVGFDNGAQAQLSYPPLTTIVNPLDAQADAAIAALRALWRGEAFVPPAPILTELIVRESTAAPLPREEKL